MCHDKISTIRGTSHACHIRLRSSLDREDLSKETFVDYNIGARFRIQQSSSIEFKTTLGRKQKGRNRNRKQKGRKQKRWHNNQQEAAAAKGFLSVDFYLQCDELQSFVTKTRYLSSSPSTSVKLKKLTLKIKLFHSMPFSKTIPYQLLIKM